MNIALSPELKNLIEYKVSSGQYPSVEVVIEAALKLLEERDRQLEWLRAEIAIGIEQADRKEVCNGREFLQRLREKAVGLTQPA